MVKYVFEVLQEAAKQRLKEDKIKVLKQNESWALKDVLRGTFDSTVTWKIPKGEVPYEPSEPHNHPANLIRENTKFKYFVKGIRECESLPSFKRERLFIGLLEGIHPEDAEVVVKMINKEPPKYITRPIVEEAFPGLLKD
jgi:hypothetical protein